MERLTEKERNFDGTAVSKESLVREYGMLQGTPSNHCIAILNKLADYEDKQEQGLLIELPVPIGAEVYKVVEDKTAATIETIKHNGHEYHRTIHCYFVCRDLFTFSMLNEVGKTVFLTYAEAKEAEEALEKMGGK